MPVTTMSFAWVSEGAATASCGAASTGGSPAVGAGPGSGTPLVARAGPGGLGAELTCCAARGAEVTSAVNDAAHSRLARTITSPLFALVGTLVVPETLVQYPLCQYKYDN